jgi:hypothetical protein
MLVEECVIPVDTPVKKPEFFAQLLCIKVPIIVCTVHIYQVTFLKIAPKICNLEFFKNVFIKSKYVPTCLGRDHQYHQGNFTL